MTKVLNLKFFNRPTLAVTQNLLGKILVRRYRGKLIKAVITEVEAYDGFKDKASHASRGLTKRNFPMFGPAGYWYVYFTYGMHWMLNITTGPKNYPAAVLVRGVKGISGPARLTKFFKIDKRFNNRLSSRKTGLWIADNGLKIKDQGLRIVKTPRIGVDYAGPVWADKPYRFILMTDSK